MTDERFTTLEPVIERLAFTIAEAAVLVMMVETTERVLAEAVSAGGVKPPIPANTWQRIVTQAVKVRERLGEHAIEPAL